MKRFQKGEATLIVLFVVFIWGSAILQHQGVIFKDAKPAPSIIK